MEVVGRTPIHPWSMVLSTVVHDGEGGRVGVAARRRSARHPAANTAAAASGTGFVQGVAVTVVGGALLALVHLSTDASADDLIVDLM